MSTTYIESALADVRAQVASAQVAAVRAGGAAWTGAAADAAEVRRLDLLVGLRRCVDALDAVDQLVADVRRAEQAAPTCRAAALAGAGYALGPMVWP